jgi:hypothetical protein
MSPVENHRVQVFDSNGKYEAQWNNLHRPCGLFMPPGNARSATSASLARCSPVSRNVPNLGPRVTIVDHRQAYRAAGRDGPGHRANRVPRPHGLTVDSHGDLYTSGGVVDNWPQTWPVKPRPDNLRSLHKDFRKV